MAETPSLERVLLDAIDGRLFDLHTCMPGLVESYDPATGFASISPCPKRKYTSGDLVDLPVLNNVPVVMPRAAGGAAYIHVPLAKGDPVLIVFAERSIDAWKTAGGKYDPNDPRKHHLSDAFALPGGYAKAASRMQAATAGDIVVANGDATLKVKADKSIEADNGKGKMTIGADGKVSATSGQGGVTIEIDTVGKLKITNAGGEFLAALVQVLSSTTTAGGYPLIADPTAYGIIQGFKA
jgi:hypothetical protein